MVLLISLKPQKDQSFSEKIDPEVISTFAFFLVKILEINEESVPNNPQFPTIMLLMTRTLIEVSEPEMT